MVKIINTYDNYSLIERNNATRKGYYYQAKYKDINGKEHVLERKSNTISITQFQDNLNKVKGLTNAKDKRKLSNSYYSPITTRKENIRKNKIQKQEVQEKFKTQKDYTLEKELSNNKLFDNKNRFKHNGKFKTESDYHNEEIVICLRVGSRSELSNLSESDFERRVKSYLRISNPVGNQKLFIDDLVNLWGVEFKK
jgi:hypothetical protein